MAETSMCLDALPRKLMGDDHVAPAHGGPGMDGHSGLPSKASSPGLEQPRVR